MSLRPETTRQVDALVADAQSAGHVPSLIVGVVRGGGLAHVTSVGEQPSPDVDLQYRISSITKTMTAVLIMQERDAGFANSYGFRSGHIGALGQQVLTRVLDAEPRPSLPWRPALGRRGRAGRSLVMDGHAARHQLGRATGELIGALRGELLSRYALDAPDRWRGRSGPEDGETLTVLRDETGRPVALDIATFVFTRTPDDEP
ncbi:serine hydrolase [Micromonospora sp. LOL_024]|uniref:DUF7586 domain-containing protein n=1 Tax=Micromonospora sp. LOL_024 TaxID=3345412 RepID=UPI003A8977E4